MSSQSLCATIIILIDSVRAGVCNRPVLYLLLFCNAAKSIILVAASGHRVLNSNLTFRILASLLSVSVTAEGVRKLFYNFTCVKKINFDKCIVFSWTYL